LVLWLGILRGATPQMPVSEIKAGMEGTGVTVFDGARRQEFKARILGVLENVVGPRRNLILARLEGGRLADTGVMQGMSGSPVYIDGRLIGAVSFSLGAFSKEPIAGITPIAEMLDATAASAARPASARAAAAFRFDRWPPTHEDYVAALRAGFARLSPYGSGPVDGRAFNVSSIAGFPVGATLQPIATPLTMSGFSGDTHSALASALSNIGFVPVSGSAATGADDQATRGGARPAPGARSATAAPALTGGDAVGVALVSGDLALGATGTVTLVEGNRVYAFGHPFFNLGPTEFPMTKAYVVTLLPSLFASSKLASIGEVVGTIQQDRATAIAGTLGPGPALVPVTLTLSSERGPSRTFKFGVVKDQMLTPLLTFAAITNTLQSYEREFGAATFTVRGQASVKGYGSVALENIFTGDTPGIGAAAYVAGPLSALLSNDVAPIQIDAVDLTINAFEEPRTTTLERAWLDDEQPKAGDTVKLHILTRTYRGEDKLQTVDVAIPSNASGTLSVVVSDGARLTALESADQKSPQQARSIDQMIRLFNQARRNNRIYVKLVAPQAGAIINGETLSALPPSVLAIIDADRENAGVRRTSSAVLGEWELPSENAIVGQRTLTLAVREP
jgi:hypothetical protein